MKRPAVGGPLDGLLRTWPRVPFVWLDDRGRRSRDATHLYVWEEGEWRWGGGRYRVCWGCGALHGAPVFPDSPCDLCGGKLRPVPPPRLP